MHTQHRGSVKKKASSATLAPAIEYVYVPADDFNATMDEIVELIMKPT